MKYTAAVLTAFLIVQTSLFGQALKVGYSDWPGWVAWEIAIKKGWFEEENLDIEFVWMDYVESMESFAQGSVDAVCMTNGDALVTGAGSLSPDGSIPAKPSTCILLNDFSYGNDMVVAAPGIKSFADLVGKSVALEEGFVAHLLFLTGVEEQGIDPKSITIVNTPTDKTPNALRSGVVKAVAAWQPSSGEALASVAGANEIFSSADAPGIIFDGLFVDRENLKENRSKWKKVVRVWYKVVSFMKDESNRDEVLEILSERVELSPAEYAALLEGTYILSTEEALRCWNKRSSISSIYGSSSYVDSFNIKYEVYSKPQNIDSYFDPTFIEAFRVPKK